VCLSRVTCTPFDTTFGAHVDQVVSALDDIHVVFDDDDGIAFIDETLQNVHQQANIFESEDRSSVRRECRGSCRSNGAQSSVASFTRCASPPESVVAAWPSFM
jgi:hypothetical protein